MKNIGVTRDATVVSASAKLVRTVQKRQRTLFATLHFSLCTFHFSLTCGRFVIAQGVAEPGAGISPVTVGCTPTNAHDLGRFAEREAGESTEPHQLGTGGVLASQRLKRVVERQQVIAGRIVQHGIEVDADATPTSAPLLPAAIAGPVDQDPAHGFGRGGEEVAAPGPRFLRIITDQPEVRLVDKGCGFQRLPRSLVGHFLGRQFAQLVVDQRQEPAGSARIALLDHGKDVRHRRGLGRDTNHVRSLEGTCRHLAYWIRRAAYGFFVGWAYGGSRLVLATGIDPSLFGMNIAAEAPDQLAVVLKVKHCQGLDRAEHQDLIAPEVGAQQHVAHPGFHDGPRIACSLAQDNLDPSSGYPAMSAQIGDDPPPRGQVVGRKTRELEQQGQRSLASIHGVPERSQVHDGVGQPGRELSRVLAAIGCEFHDGLQALDREGERGDIVVVEDARGHNRPQGLAAAIGQVGKLLGEIGGEQVERPAESIEPARDPFQAFLVLMAKLLGDDPTSPRVSA